MICDLSFVICHLRLRVADELGGKNANDVGDDPILPHDFRVAVRSVGSCSGVDDSGARWNGNRISLAGLVGDPDLHGDGAVGRHGL